jgi:hypothetical protein
MPDGVPHEPVSFIIFSDDWGRHPSSCQYLFRHLLPRYRTFWVNTIGMRRTHLTAPIDARSIRSVAVPRP